jgi:predicted DCC family thiol-disulfide oxidoreductase YuxK
MLRAMPQPLIRPDGRHLLLFDGDCGLCGSLVQFVLARDPAGTFHFASLSSPYGRSTVAYYGGDADDTSTMYVVVDFRTPQARPLIRSRAALFVIGAIGWPWKAVTLFGVLPTALLERLYDVVARNRYRVLGRREQCLMPRAEWQDRFVDLPEPISNLAGG